MKKQFKVLSKFEFQITYIDGKKKSIQNKEGEREEHK